MVNGKLYSFSGYGGMSGPQPWAYVFDPTAGNNGQGKWIRIKDMPSMRETTTYGGVTHAGIANDGRYIYIANGYPASSSGTGQSFSTTYVVRYDTTTDSYERLPNLPALRGAGSLAIVNGELHFFGGTNNARTLETPEHWAITLDGILTNTWKTRKALPNPRHHMAAVSYGGKIYAIGGQHKHDSALVPQRSVDMYDPATDTWVAKAPLPLPRNHIGSSTVVLDGRILVLGGQSTHNVREEEVYVYDIATNTWSQIGSLPEARHSAVAGVINGQIYMTSGTTPNGTSRNTYRGTKVFTRGLAAPTMTAARTPFWQQVAVRFGSAPKSADRFFCEITPPLAQGEPSNAPVAARSSADLARALRSYRRRIQQISGRRRIVRRLR